MKVEKNYDNTVYEIALGAFPVTKRTSPNHMTGANKEPSIFLHPFNKPFSLVFLRTIKTKEKGSVGHKSLFSPTYMCVLSRVCEALCFLSLS